MPRNQPSDGYSKARSHMRVIGPALLVFGGILALIGVGQFLLTFIQTASSEPFSRDRPDFPILFPILGMPGLLLLGIGLLITKAGYLREVSQYAAKETTPAVRTTTTAVRSAWADGKVPCPSCASPIEPGSKFCPKCGVMISGGTCKVCQASVDSNDKFCASCGAGVAE